MDYQNKFDRTQTILIFSLVLIAAGLRIPKIGIPLYNEEYVDLFWFGQIPWKDLILEYTNPGQKTLVAIIWKVTKLNLFLILFDIEKSFVWDSISTILFLLAES